MAKLRKSWFSYSAHLDISSVSTTIDMYELYDTRDGRVRSTHATEAEAEAALRSLPSFFQRLFAIRGVGSTEVIRRGQQVVPVSPLPVFDVPFRILATRGFWDTTLDILRGTTRVRSVANFAIGMIVLPVKSVYVNTAGEGEVPSLSLRSPQDFPDILLDDAGWFVYESFVRITETGNLTTFDPPFYSKAKRKVPANSAVAMVIGYDITGLDREGLTAANLTFGCRWRMLVEK